MGEDEDNAVNGYDGKDNHEDVHAGVVGYGVGPLEIYDMRKETDPKLFVYALIWCGRLHVDFGRAIAS